MKNTNCSHPILTRLNHDQLEYEVIDSKKDIESKLGCEVELFCYPNGQESDINGTVIEVVKQAGYLSAVTTIPGCNTNKDVDPFLLKRITFHSDDKVQMLKQLTILS